MLVAIHVFEPCQLSQPSLSECVIQIVKSICGLRENLKKRASHHLSTCAYCLFRDLHVTLGLFGPRRLGVAGEHPRDCGVPWKVCNGRFHRRKGRSQLVEGGKGVGKDSG